jgi:hydrogenase maturation protease
LYKQYYLNHEIHDNSKVGAQLALQSLTLAYCALINEKTSSPSWDAEDILKVESVVIGLGNLYMRDDGFGLRVAEALKKMDLGESVSVQEYPEMDLAVIEQLKDTSKVIIVDTVKGGKKPGTVSKYTFTARKEDIAELPSLHSMKLSDLLDIAVSSGILTCPVVIVGVEPKDDSVGTELSSEVESALPKAVEAVIRELGKSPV